MFLNFCIVDLLKGKIGIIEKMEPRNIADLLPLVQTPTVELIKVKRKMLSETDYIPEKNRIYFFSNRLNVEPSVVSRHFASYLFMFQIPFNQLVENLNVIQGYNVSHENILCDLWAFNYHPSLVRKRLGRCQKSQLGTLKLWMIRCKESILKRSVELAQEKKNVFGDDTAVEYISKRLKYDIKTTEKVVSKHEKVLHVNASKMKKVLDYLLIEEKFEPFQVAYVIQILGHSLETTRSRINELKSFGFRPVSLHVVCRSKKNYNKFLTRLNNDRKRTVMKNKDP